MAKVGGHEKLNQITLGYLGGVAYPSEEKDEEKGIEFSNGKGKMIR